MKNLRTTTILAIAFIGLTAMSCKETKKEGNTEQSNANEMHNGEHANHEGMDSDIDNENMNASETKVEMNEKTSTATAVIDNYLKLKDALVGDNNKDAAKIGEALATSFGSFDISGFTNEQQKELTEIIEVANEHAEHIAKSDIKHQREHFESLSNDMVDLLAITGTSKKLYQQRCPMYNNNKGGIWLSASNEIKNPLFGSKMLTCGTVQKEIN